jgi:sugar-specific transcriptional regulator TrmB
MLKNILQNLGFKDQEITIFLQTASLWISPASLIAKKTNLKRTTCYQILEQLCQKWIIKKHIKSKLKYYEAISIDELMYFIKKNVDDLNLAYKNLKKEKNELEKIYQKNIWDTTISFYEWFDDIKQAYDNILDSWDSEIYSLTKKRFSTSNHALSQYWIKYLNHRILYKKTSYNIINWENINKIDFKIEHKKLRNTLQIPNNILPIFWDIKVSWDKFVIISQQEWRIFGILIQNQELANMFKNIFKILWGNFILTGPHKKSLK